MNFYACQLTVKSIHEQNVFIENYAWARSSSLSSLIPGIQELWLFLRYFEAVIMNKMVERLKIFWSTGIIEAIARDSVMHHDPFSFPIIIISQYAVGVTMYVNQGRKNRLLVYLGRCDY